MPDQLSSFYSSIAADLDSILGLDRTDQQPYSLDEREPIPTTLQWPRNDGFVVSSPQVPEYTSIAPENGSNKSYSIPLTFSNVRDKCSEPGPTDSVDLHANCYLDPFILNDEDIRAWSDSFGKHDYLLYLRKIMEDSNPPSPNISETHEHCLQGWNCKRPSVQDVVPSSHQASWLSASTPIDGKTVKDDPADLSSLEYLLDKQQSEIRSEYLECDAKESSLRLEDLLEIRDSPQLNHQLLPRYDTFRHENGIPRHRTHLINDFLTSLQPNNSPTSASEEGATASPEGASENEEFTYFGEFELQKDLLIAQLMLRVHGIFETLTTSSCNSSTGSNFSSPPTTLNEYSEKPTESKRRSRNLKRSNDSDEEDANDSDNKRRRMPNNSVASREENSLKLACPYYKHDPHKYHPLRACRGPGWNKVHRLKEHLYRVHSIPMHCPRCRAIFSREEELTEHSRAPEICQVRNTPLEGLTKDQERQLRYKRDMFRAPSEEEKWKIVYLILFPDTAIGELPSPYYEVVEVVSADTATNQSPGSAEFTQYDAYMRRELPREVRKALLPIIEMTMGPIEETLQNRLEGIVRDRLEALARNYSNMTVSRTSFAVQNQEPFLHHAPESAVSEGLITECMDEFFKEQYEGSGPWGLPPDVLLDMDLDEESWPFFQASISSMYDSAYSSGPSFPSSSGRHGVFLREDLGESVQSSDALHLDETHNDDNNYSRREFHNQHTLSEPGPANQYLMREELSNELVTSKSTKEKYKGKGKARANADVIYEQ